MFVLRPQADRPKLNRPTGRRARPVARGTRSRPIDRRSAKSGRGRSDAAELECPGGFPPSPLKRRRHNSSRSPDRGGESSVASESAKRCHNRRRIAPREPPRGSAPSRPHRSGGPKPPIRQNRFRLRSGRDDGSRSRRRDRSVRPAGIRRSSVAANKPGGGPRNQSPVPICHCGS